MKTLSFWKKSFYSGLVFFGTVVVLTVGYAVWNNPYVMSPVGSGSGLTANGWNALVNNIDDLNSRWSRVGSDITFTGGNVGIGGTNPNKLYIYSADANKTAVTIYRPIAAFTDNIFNHTSLFLGGSDQGYGLAMGVRGDNKVFLQWMVNNVGTGSNTSILLAPDSGNVGIGTTNPAERLDLWGGNIKMGLSYPTNVTIAINVASQTMSPVAQICPTGTSIIGGSCWTQASGNVACPVYYGVGGNNANIQAWNCGNTASNILCSAVCANMK